jgi:hypothetical protein
MAEHWSIGIPLIPGKGLLEEHRSMIRMELGQILLEVSALPEDIRRICSCVTSQAFSWMELLRKQGLWPAKIVNASISSAIKKVEAVSNSLPSQHSTSCGYSGRHFDSKQKERLTYEMDIIKNRGGLCVESSTKGVYMDSLVWRLMQYVL